jgi:6-phosphofructokinase 1
LKADYAIIGDIVRKVGHAPVTRAYVRAGPRPLLFFTPKAVRAAIMTVGGLCPGLNNVIRELTRTLINVYEVDAVLGLRDGLWGLHDTAPDDELELTLKQVQDIHKRGGSILGSARGGLSPELLPKAVEAVKRRRLSMLFIIGGDGTHRAAAVLSAALREAGVVCSVVCIPKTIDNDIDIIDRSFGFSTAVAEAIKAVEAARTEAQAAPAGIGLVKVMGRNAGFIAAHAALACGVVDVCLIPEVPVVLHGKEGILGHIEGAIRRKGYAVVLTAEGAGQELVRQAEAKAKDEAGASSSSSSSSSSSDTAAAAAAAAADGGGHQKLKPIAKFLRSTIKDHFAAIGQEANIKLIDPSYIVRSVEACATDALYCLLLGQNAVHAAMSGFTEISLGLCNNRMVYLPITSIVANSPRVMDPLGRTWERVVSTTGQPNTAKPLQGSAAHAITGRTIF